MCGVAVDFHIEDVAGAFVLVIRAFDLCLVLGCAVIVHGNVAGVGVVVLVRNAGQNAEGLLVLLGELSCKAFCGSCEAGEVVLVGLREAVYLLCHVGNDTEAKLLGFFAFTVVLADECDEAFGKADEADCQGALVDDGLDGVVIVKLLAAQPEAVHQERELLLESGLLEIEALVELSGRYVKSPVELLEELLDAFVLVLLLVHGFDGELHDIDGGEAEVTAADGGLGAELVVVNTGTAAHGCNLVDVALRVVGLPGVVLVVGGIQVQEVGEETAGRNLAGELVEVVVGVFGKVAHAPLLLPDLDGEDCGGAVADALIGGVQDFTDDAASFCRCVRTIVDGGEHNLVAATAVDGVHVVNESLHGLVYAAHGLVDGVLLCPLLALKADEVTLEIVVDLCALEFGEVLVLHGAHLVDFLLVGLAYVRSKIEVEGGDGLAAVHLVLDCFHGDTCKHRGGLDPLGGTGLTVTGLETVLKDEVQRVLDAGE